MHRSLPNHPEYEVKSRTDIRITFFSLGRRVAPLALGLALSGCLQTDPAGKGPDEREPTGIQDAGQLAGATSSTNWPTDDGGRIAWTVRGVADTAISLRFTGSDGAFCPATGTFTLYEFGPIPALDSVRSLAIPFSSMDTVRLSPEAFLPLFPNGEDTLRFSLNITTDTSQCLLVGFVYSVKEGRFLSSPLPSRPSFRMRNAGFSFRGEADTSLSKIGPSFAGKNQWCFYIPGSPYFWMVDPDSVLEIGPLPLGSYPLRLLRIIPEENRSDRSRMEIIAMQFVKVSALPGAKAFRFQAGETLQSIDVPADLSLRPR
jgi:hypothetical protein